MNLNYSVRIKALLTGLPTRKPLLCRDSKRGMVMKHEKVT